MARASVLSAAFLAVLWCTVAAGWPSLDAYGSQVSRHRVEAADGPLMVCSDEDRVYACVISSTFRLGIAPATVYKLLTYPDNSGVIRSVKKTTIRDQRELEPKLQEFIVDHEVQISLLGFTRQFKNRIRVQNDARHPKRLVQTYGLVTSDSQMSDWSGRWELVAAVDRRGRTVGTDVTLTHTFRLSGATRLLARGSRLLERQLSSHARSYYSAGQEDLEYVADQARKNPNRTVKQLMQDIKRSRGIDTEGFEEAAADTFYLMDDAVIREEAQEFYG